MLWLFIYAIVAVIGFYVVAGVVAAPFILLNKMADAIVRPFRERREFRDAQRRNAEAAQRIAAARTR